jgi:hypothetical protein
MPQAGVNRAYPYARFDDDKLEAHGTALFRIAHNPNFNLAIQALQLVFQVTHFICIHISDGSMLERLYGSSLVSPYFFSGRLDELSF